MYRPIFQMALAIVFLVLVAMTTEANSGELNRYMQLTYLWLILPRGVHPVAEWIRNLHHSHFRWEEEMFCTWNIGTVSEPSQEEKKCLVDASFMYIKIFFPSSSTAKLHLLKIISFSLRRLSFLHQKFLLLGNLSCMHRIFSPLKG